jgi:MoxR-like ATPase
MNNRTIAGITASPVGVADAFGVAAPKTLSVSGLAPGHDKAHMVPAWQHHEFPEDAISRALAWRESSLRLEGFLNLWGPTGSGKSSFVDQMYARLGVPVIKVDCNEETETRDLLGGMQLVDGSTCPVPGPIAVAASMGIPVILEEFDRMEPAKTVGLNGVLSGGPVRLVDDPGVVYQRQDGFEIVVTTNTNLGRDPFGNYVGGKHDVSTLDRRFPIYVGYLEPELEVRLLLEANADVTDPGFKAFAEKAVRLANAIRSLFEEGSSDFTLSTRTLLRWAYCNLMFENSARRAGISASLYSLNAAFADGLDPESRTSLFEAYQAAFGEDQRQFNGALQKLGRNQYRVGASSADAGAMNG